MELKLSQIMPKNHVKLKYFANKFKRTCDWFESHYFIPPPIGVVGPKGLNSARSNWSGIPKKQMQFRSYTDRRYCNYSWIHTDLHLKK